MISSIVGRFIFTIQSCHPSATSCIAAPAALSTAPAASATVLAPARFAFSPGTLRAGRSLSGDSEICRDGFEIESFANKLPQRDDKVVCRYMATLHQLLRRELRQPHLFLLTDSICPLQFCHELSHDPLPEKGPDWGFVVVDGNLVTGQNPASSEAAAKKLLKLL